METGMNGAMTADYSENGSVGAVGEGNQRLEASAESSGSERTTKNKENGDLRSESLTSTPFEAKPKSIRSMPLSPSLYPNGQPRFKLIRERRNGRLVIYEVPVPMKEPPVYLKRVLRCRRENGKIKVSWIGGEPSFYRPLVPKDQRR